MAPNEAVLTRSGVDRRETEQEGEVRSLTSDIERKICLSIRACQREHFFRAFSGLVVAGRAEKASIGRPSRRATRPRPRFFAREGFCALCRAHRTRLPAPHPPYVAPRARGVGPLRACAPVTSGFLLSLPPSPAPRLLNDPPNSRTEFRPEPE